MIIYLYLKVKKPTPIWYELFIYFITITIRLAINSLNKLKIATMYLKYIIISLLIIKSIDYVIALIIIEGG